jgi:hypothetical protein
MEAVRTSETSVDNHFTRQYIPEDNSEHHTRRRENLKSHKIQGHFSPSSSCFTAGRLLVTARAPVGKSGMIRTRMGKHNRIVMVAVYRTLCAIPPRTQ